MSPNPSYYRKLGRLEGAAQREIDAVLKSLPPEFRDRVKDISIRCEAKPAPQMIESGLSAEAFSTTNRDAKEIVLFVMNLCDRYGKFPGEFSRQLRKVLVNELADSAGLEVDWEY